MIHRWNRFTFHDNRDLQRANHRRRRRCDRLTLRRLLPLVNLKGGPVRWV